MDSSSFSKFGGCVMAAALLFVGSAHGVTVIINGGLGQPSLELPAGGPVPDGNAVWVGYFNGGFDILGNADDPAALLTQWNSFGQLTVMTITGSPGRVAGSVTHVDASFDGQQPYLWVLKTTANGLPSLDLSDVESHVLLTSTQPSWSFPVEGSATTSTLLSLSEVETVFNGTEVNGGGGVEAFQLAVSIPEPTSLLLLLGGCGFLVTRRGRQPVS